MPKVIGVIPARLNSKRFPAKALAPLKGKPLLFYVWNQTRKAKSVDRVIIATDSKEIATAAEAFGAEVLMTSIRARNGSERVAEVAGKISGDIFASVQGDFLHFNPRWIDAGASALAGRKNLHFLTLVTRIRDDRELFDPDRVKAVVTSSERSGVSGAQWFSRYPVPFVRSDNQKADAEHWKQFKYWKHLGIYFYRRSGLRLYQSWAPGEYEKAESLEQLRILENGKRIGVIEVRGKSVCVDSPKDLEGI